MSLVFRYLHLFNRKLCGSLFLLIFNILSNAFVHTAEQIYDGSTIHNQMAGGLKLSQRIRRAAIFVITTADSGAEKNS